MFRLILCFALFCILHSCQPPVVFGEPQPVGIEPILNIPKSYQGIFWCKADSVSLVVDNKSFIKRKELSVRLTAEEIEADPELQLQNNRLYVTSWEQSFPIERKADTLITSVILKDTIFAIRQGQVLKPFKGHLILNTKYDEDAWGVWVVSHKGEGIISLARAELPENLTNLNFVTPVGTLAKKNNKESQILIKPTKEEFEKILENRLLFDTSCTEFQRIIPLQ